MKEILESLNVDRYFKAIIPSGVIFIIAGTFSGNTQIIKFGVTTFIYGIWAWMLGATFHIEAKINLSETSKSKPIYFAIIYALICAFFFIVYVYITIRLFL